ncbi:MAG: hypothetical protein V3T17_12115 [Pseudomonadales bacterium]
MSINHKRRSRLVGLSARKESWDIETLKEQNRVAMQALVDLEKAVQQVATDIEQSENLLCCAMTGQLNLDVSTLQSTRIYLAEQHGIYKQRKTEWRRAEQRAKQAELQLKQATLTIKALERVKASSDQIISREQQTHIQEDNVELWLQHAMRIDSL